MNRLTIDAEGRLALPPRVAEALGSKDLEIVSVSGDHLLLSAESDGAGVDFAGRLGEIAIPDLLSFLNMFRKTGVVSFVLEGGVKRLYFDGGEIVYASSTFAHEQFIPFFAAQGKLDSDLVQQLRLAPSSPVALGNLLVDRKIVTSKELWLLVRRLVEQIVYDLFTFPSGGFACVHRAPAGDEILRLSLSTQNLIMEGLRRLDERALFMGVIRSMRATAVATGKAAEGLGETEARLLALVTEGGEVGQILDRGGLGEFEGLKLLYELAERGLVDFVQPPSDASQPDLGDLLSAFDAITSELHAKLPATEEDRQTLRAFMRDLPQPLSYLFHKGELREDGSVVAAQLLGNLERLEEGDKRGLLADGLSELLFMRCHLARARYGKSASAEALGAVKAALQRINTHVGRNQ